MNTLFGKMENECKGTIGYCILDIGQLDIVIPGTIGIIYAIGICLKLSASVPHALLPSTGRRNSVIRAFVRQNRIRNSCIRTPKAHS